MMAKFIGFGVIFFTAEAGRRVRMRRDIVSRICFIFVGELFYTESIRLNRVLVGDVV